MRNLKKDFLLRNSTQFSIHLLIIHNFVSRKTRKTGQFSTGFKSCLEQNLGEKEKEFCEYDFLTLLMVVKVLLV